MSEAKEHTNEQPSEDSDTIQALDHCNQVP